MIVPELLVVVAADKLFACLVVCHFCRGALEFGDIVEEVEREEYHGRNKPFECEDQKNAELILVLSADALQQSFYLVFFLP